MKLRDLKSKWGIYLFLFYLFIAVMTLDIAAYGSREFHRMIPWDIQDFFLYFTLGFTRVIEYIWPRFYFSGPMDLIIILLINFLFFYFIGFGLEKLYKRIRKKVK